MKKYWLKKCLQPGTKGMEARKKMETGWKFGKLFFWIPVIGWVCRFVVGLFYPTMDEINAAMQSGRID